MSQRNWLNKLHCSSVLQQLQSAQSQGQAHSYGSDWYKIILVKCLSLKAYWRALSFQIAHIYLSYTLQDQ